MLGKSLPISQICHNFLHGVVRVHVHVHACVPVCPPSRVLIITHMPLNNLYSFPVPFYSTYVPSIFLMGMVLVTKSIMNTC